MNAVKLDFVMPIMLCDLHLSMFSFFVSECEDATEEDLCMLCGSTN